VTKERANTLILTALAMLAFAANSVLTRRALAGSDIAPGTFVAIRLISGALMLGALGVWRPGSIIPRRSDLGGIGFLLVYAVAFTFAYVRLGAAVGALILFPTVQLTLVTLASLRGSLPSRREVLGSFTALAGIAWLLAPNVTMPSLVAAGMMALAGVAWGLYTAQGRGTKDPFARTARNFLGAAPLAFLLALASPGLHPSALGIVLAVVSGAVTSGLGYVLWYTVLPRLTASGAGAAQLLVPAIASVAGVTWLGEQASVALVGGSTLILLGVGLVMGIALELPPAAR
jgi:drug/metabolite transporter (DMT)-like permease